MLIVLAGLCGVAVGLIAGWRLFGCRQVNRSTFRTRDGERSTTFAATSSLAAASSSDGSLHALAARLSQSHGKLEQRLPSLEKRLAAQVQNLEASLAQVRIDGLTGLADQKAFEEELCRRLAEWRRKKTPLAILRVDLDHFQRIHQQHGSEAADSLLRGVALVLCGSLREMDLIARLGRDEFVVMLPSTTGSEAVAAAKRVRAEIASAVFPIAELLLKITVSIGVAEAVPGDHVALLMERADAALDASKRAGRNAVHTYTRRGMKSVPAFEPEGFLPAAASGPAGI
jgi:diguanylate cyclase